MKFRLKKVCLKDGSCHYIPQFSEGGIVFRSWTNILKIDGVGLVLSNDFEPKFTESEARNYLYAYKKHLQDIQAEFVDHEEYEILDV